MAPLILAMPEEAKRILCTVADWGVNRVSIGRDSLFR